jgi:hypothetical protein
MALSRSLGWAAPQRRSATVFAVGGRCGNCDDAALERKITTRITAPVAVAA